MHLSPAILKAAYDLLAETRPFCNWHLPDSDDVKFIVHAAKEYGYCRGNEIGISTYRVGRMDCLLETMAHEMIHVYLDRLGVKSSHGRPFHKLARQVCREHGFDFKRFV